MNRLLVVCAALLALATGASADATARKTAVATWNPFDAAGAVKQSLAIKPLGRGGCGPGPGSEVIGDFGYRCGAKNRMVDPCWRDGGAPTDMVVCPVGSWARSVATIRVPHLMLTAGVTFAAPVDSRRDPPWALELVDGNRCILEQGAHASVGTKRGRLWVDYACNRGNIYLLRNLERGRVWRIGAARWTGRRFQLRGRVAVRRAFFPSLPPAMQRQNDLARQAAAASGLRLARVLRVRISFPTLDWANVQALTPVTSKAITVWRVVHRRGRNWRVVRLQRPFCRNRQLPANARRQLFGCGLPRSVRAQLDQ